MVMHFALQIMKRIWYYQLWDGEERVPTHFMLGPLDMPNYARQTEPQSNVHENQLACALQQPEGTKSNKDICIHVLG
jgi:hypothetical protein